MQEKIKSSLSQFLILSIAVSVICVLSGGVLYLMQMGQETVAYQVFSPKSETYTGFRQVIWGILQFKPQALIILGFLILVVSQMLRVLALGFFFLETREIFLGLASFFIFIILLYSMLWHE